MIVYFIIRIIDWRLLYIFDLFVFINWWRWFCNHALSICKLGMSKITLIVVKSGYLAKEVYRFDWEFGERFLQTLNSLIYTWFTYSKGLKCLTLLIIETYTLACSIFKISQFIIYKPSNIIYTSFSFGVASLFCSASNQTWIFFSIDAKWCVLRCFHG
jgi:hypothetical protein